VGAYAKAEAVLAQLDRAGAAGADALRGQTCIPRQEGLKRRTMLVGSAAAGLVVAAGGATLANTYKNLTGRASAWADFTAFLNAHFSGSQWYDLDSDNPFPV